MDETTRHPATTETSVSPLSRLPGLAGITWIGIFALLAAILIYGRAVLIPLAVAVLIWSLINALTRVIDRAGMGVVALPRRFRMFLAIIIMILAGWMVAALIASNVADVSGAAPLYEQNVRAVLPAIFASLGISEPPQMGDILARIDIGSVVTNLTSAIGSMISNVGLIALYVAFLLMEQESFDKKVEALFPRRERADHVRKVLTRIETQIERYLWIKTLMSLATAVLSYVVLRFVGVDYAEFWALVVFLFNYIPTVGSILAVFLPALLTILQFASFGTFLTVLVPLVTIQVIIGNVVEPRFMGNQLNLSPLVLMLSLSLWGSIWGIAGMFLCVPLMVILLIILAQFPETRPLAVLMSSSGSIEQD